MTARPFVAELLSGDLRSEKIEGEAERKFFFEKAKLMFKHH